MSVHCDGCGKNCYDAYIRCYEDALPRAHLCKECLAEITSPERLQKKLAAIIKDCLSKD